MLIPRATAVDRLGAHMLRMGFLNSVGIIMFYYSIMCCYIILYYMVVYYDI